MKKIVVLIALAMLTAAAVSGQEDGQRERLQERLLRRFDADGDGQLSPTEKARMREQLRQRRAAQPKTQSAGPSDLRGLYGQSAPEMGLAQVDLELYDKTRDRTVPVRVTYPKSPGKWPVIVWSHGLFGSQDNYGPLVQHWASHGYLVIAPSHTDSLLRGQGDLSKGMSGNVKDWANRPKDVSFVIDSLASHPKLAPYANPSRVGVGGHSFGGHTTVLVGGAAPALGASLSDPRPRAFLSVSPPGNSPLLGPAAWKGLTRPTMFVSGDLDDSPGGEKAVWRLDSYKGSPDGDKFLLWIKDAHHHFGGISGARRRSAPANPDQVEIVKSASLAFWDSFLKANSQADRVLKTGDLGGRSRELYTWEAK